MRDKNIAFVEDQEHPEMTPEEINPDYDTETHKGRSKVWLYILIVVLVIGCGMFAYWKFCIDIPAHRAEKIQDSIRIADSIAHVEEEIRLAAVEEARQDSLEKINKFRSSLPDFETLFKNTMLDGDIENLKLESLGFTRKEIINHIKDEDYGFEHDETIVEYVLTVDSSHFCSIKQEPGMESIWTTFTIMGYPDIMDEYKATASDFINSGKNKLYGVGEPTIEIKRNEIVWCDGV